MPLAEDPVERVIDTLLSGLGVDESLKGYSFNLYARPTPFRVEIDQQLHRKLNRIEDVDVQKLDKHIDTLKLALITTQKKLSERISAAQLIRNNLAAVHRLPNELLIRIFSMALEGVSVRHRYAEMAKMTRVSRSWHGLIEGTPSLWAFVSSCHPDGLIRRALTKSKPYPLTVSCSVKPPSAHFYPVLHQISRWRSADLLVTNDSGIQARLSTQAPLLESLFLRRTTQYRVTPLDIFSGNCPRLTDLTLQGVPIRWNAAMLSGLQSLDIKDIEALGPIIGQLLHILANSPHLKTLILERIRFTSTDHLEDLPFAHLTFLEKLHLQLPPTHMDAILDHIRASSCKRLKVSWPHASQSSCQPGTFNTSLDQFRRLLVSSVDISNGITLDVSNACTRFIMTNFELDVNHSAFGRYKLLSWISNILVREPVTCPVTLSLGDRSKTENNTALFECFDRLGCVTELEVKTPSKAPGIIAHLGTPRMVGHNLEWPLPMLEKLVVGDVNIGGEEILGMVKHRYGLAEGYNDAEGPDPAPFASLHISNYVLYDGEIYDELREIMGEGCVSWEQPRSDEDDEDDGDFIVYHPYDFF